MNPYDDATLDSLPDSAWDTLAEGANRGRHPFHTVTLATMGQGGAQARTVVLRSADPATRTLSCHTDLRSAKVEELRTDPRCTWLFYDREGKLQLRLSGEARVHVDNALTHERWAAGASRSRQCYRPLAPGAPCVAGDLDVPAEAEPEGMAHFAVLTCVVDTFEWLYLRAAGHRRARFQWRDGAWAGTWIGA